MSQSPSLFSSSSTDTSSSLRLISCNLQYGTPATGWDKKKGRVGVRGFTPDTNEARLALRTAACEIKSFNPDILLLQEVDMYQARSGYINQAAFLADALHMDYWHYVPTFAGHVVGVHQKPRSIIASRKHSCGVALLSRFPLQRALSLPLPGYKSLPDVFPRFEGNITLVPSMLSYSTKLATYVKKRIKNQPRVVQGALVDTPLGTLAIGNTHLEIQHTVAQRQTHLAWMALRSLEADAYLLAGDFNLSPRSVDSALASLPEHELPDAHYCATTFPASDPQHEIDQLLLRALHASKPPQTRRLSISDHLTVIYDLCK